jgi:hypothetical protein
MLKKIACGGLSSRVPALGGRIKHANLYTGGLDMERGKKNLEKIFACGAPSYRSSF